MVGFFILFLKPTLVSDLYISIPLICAACTIFISIAGYLFYPYILGAIGKARFDSMMLQVLCVLLVFSGNALASSCLDLEDSGDGAPAEYFQEKCLAEASFSNGDFGQAAQHYAKASSVQFHEAPNYSLRLEWGHSLCLNGDIDRGRELINSFVLMAKADLGEFLCPTEADDLADAIQEEHMALACIGTGSALSEIGKRALINKMNLVPNKELACPSL